MSEKDPRPYMATGFVIVLLVGLFAILIGHAP